MTDTIQPLVPPLEAAARPSGRTGWGLDGGAGGHLNIDTSVSEGGQGVLFSGSAYAIPNARDLLGMGLQLEFSQSDGDVFHNGYRHDRYLLKLFRGTHRALGSGREYFSLISGQNLYLGPGQADGGGTFEFGSDVFSPALFARLGGRGGISIRLYLGTVSAFPFNRFEAEEIALTTLRGGIEVRGMFLDESLAPPPAGLTNFDKSYFLAAGTHRLLRSFALAKSSATPSQQGADYFRDLFGEEGTSLPSPRVEQLGAISVINHLGNGGHEGEDLQLLLRARGGEKALLGVSKGVLTATALGLSAAEESATMATLGFTGALTMIQWPIAEAFDLGLSNRHGMESAARQKKARNFLLVRSLTLAPLYAIGWAARDAKYGSGLLQATSQSMAANALDPDSAETGLHVGTSHHGVMEWNSADGGYLGYSQTAHLRSSHLYTRTRVLAQIFPGPDVVQTEVTDPLTGRDPQYQAAEARVSAGLGFEAETGPVVWQGGAHTLLGFGESGDLQPGAGLDGAAMFSVGGKTIRFELGLAASADILNNTPQVSVGPLLGARF